MGCTPYDLAGNGSSREEARTDAVSGGCHVKVDDVQLRNQDG